jgi:hypothetical protein
MPVTVSPVAKKISPRDGKRSRAFFELGALPGSEAGQYLNFGEDHKQLYVIKLQR